MAELLALLPLFQLREEKESKVVAKLFPNDSFRSCDE
jgi:hypothetical protein